VNGWDARECLVISLAWAGLACKSPETVQAVVHASSSTAPAPAPQVPSKTSMEARNRPTTEDEIIRRLERISSGLPKGAKLQRVAIGDVAYPRTQAENVAMGGYALLLITSIVHEPDELPLGRVTVQDVAGVLPLQRAALRRVVVDARLGAALGTHRTDELYYIPVFLTRVPSVLVVDFARNRTGLEMLRFPPPATADAFPAGISVIDDIRIPDVDVATVLAREEYGWLLQ
jgi:hypothetical protein